MHQGLLTPDYLPHPQPPISTQRPSLKSQSIIIIATVHGLLIGGGVLLFTQSCLTLCIPVSIELVMPLTHLILSCPLLFPLSIFPSIRVFSSESVLCIWWRKYWSFRFSISPSNECSGLIYFRIDCLDLLSVQGTLRSLIQHHSSKASILRYSVLLIVQLSHPHMTTGKATALTRWTFVGKVISLLFKLVCFRS